MAFPGREQISFTSAFISLLLLFFSFHNKNVLFYFESYQNECISSSMKYKIIWRFTFALFSNTK